LTIDALTIAYATIAVLALPHLLTVGRALLGDGGATVRPRLTVRQPVAQPVPVASEVSEADYAAALLVIRKRLEQQMHAELQRVITTGPVS
jgi:hypothetical protein